MLAFVGAFVIALSVLGQVFLPDRLLETPLDAAVRQTMEGDGVVAGETVPVRVTTASTVDPARSSRDVASWSRSTCTVITTDPDTPSCMSSAESEGRLLGAALDDFATDRLTGAAVNDPARLPPEAVPHEGQVVRWPAHAQKKSYPFWYPAAGTAVETRFDRTERVGGLSCYVYVAELDRQSLTSADGLFAGYLSGTVELWVEPLTGTVVRERDDVTRTAGPPASLTVESTEASVKRMTDSAHDLRDRVHLLTETLPLVGYAVGGVLLVGAVLLTLRGNRRPASTGRHSGPRSSLPADEV